MSNSCSNGRKGKSWRKPVPELTMSPTRASSLLPRTQTSRAVSCPVNRDLPPLPNDWRENIIKAGRKDSVLHQKEPARIEVASERGVAHEGETKSSPETSQVRALAVPTPGKPHETQQTHDAKAEYDRDLPMTPSKKTRDPKKKRSLQQTYRSPTPPVPAYPTRHRADLHDERGLFCGDTPHHLVYPDLPISDGMSTNGRNTPNWHASHRSATELSMDATAVDSGEDIRTTRISHLPNGLKKDAWLHMRNADRSSSFRRAWRRFVSWLWSFYARFRVSSTQPAARVMY